MTDIIQHSPSTTGAQPKRFQCRHIHTEGRRCGSASLRGEEFCYFHHTSRQPVANPRARRSRQATFDLPLPEDRGAIQLSIGEVLRRIASNSIDPRRAGLLLYGLQIAALNLPPHKPSKARTEEDSPVEEVVAHPTHGTVAPPFELPDPDLPREHTLTARLLEALRLGEQEIEAESKGRREAERQPTPVPIPQAEVQAHAEPTLPAEPTRPPMPATLPILNASEASASRSHPPSPLSQREPGARERPPSLALQ